MKITKLTKEQEALVPVYLKKWMGHGLTTTTTDREKSRESLDFVYTEILGIPKPKYVFYLDSPMAVQLAINLFKNTKFAEIVKKQLDSQLGSQLRSQLRSQLDSQLYSQLRSQLRSQLDSQLYSQLGSQLGSQLYSQLDSQLYSQLDSQLYSQLDSQLYSQLRSQLDSQLYSQLRSQLDSQLYSQLGSQLGSQKIDYYGYTYANWSYYRGIPYYGFYDYILNVLFPEKREEFQKYTKYLEFITNNHWACMFPEVAFISDFPKEINRNEKNQLHADVKPALTYRDGYSLWMLNGVAVPEKLVMTTKDKLDAREWLKEPNVDIRREAFRKIGIDQVVLSLGGKVIDTMESSVGGTYELLMCDIGLDKPRPYLKMKNQSIGEYHVEGIPMGIKSCEAALAWRNGIDKYFDPEVLT